jgi:hypothetical protein
VLVPFAVLVALSRVVLGLHYPPTSRRRCHRRALATVSTFLRHLL